MSHIHTITFTNGFFLSFNFLPGKKLLVLDDLFRKTFLFYYYIQFLITSSYLYYCRHPGN